MSSLKCASIEELVNLGLLAAHNAGGSLNVSTHGGPVCMQSAVRLLQGFLAERRNQDAGQFVRELRSARDAVRGERALTELAEDELGVYSALLDLEAELVIGLLDDESSPHFVTWLVDELLPIVIRVAPLLASLVRRT